MPEHPSCPHCGAELNSFATEGLCTACLLEAGVAPPAGGEGRSLPRLGDYELLEEIARGGMGVVFKARQVSLGRVVALKMILGGHLAGEAEVQRFRAEARAAAALQHPNIVAIHEVGERNGRHFFSMDYVAGRTLGTLLRQGPLAPAVAARYARAIAAAIHYAHQHGVLHRDIKPSNVLIDEHDEPRVTDFGLARDLGGEMGVTLTGQVLGSPNFMPPEQAAGKHRELTVAADIYSLGALLYHLVTGRPPFLASSVPETLRLVAETDPIAPRLLNPAVPPDLETLCLKCLEKDPHRRLATAGELAEELGRYLREEPIRARPIARWEKFNRWYRRHPAIAALTGGIGLLLIAVAFISVVAAARLQRANRAGHMQLRASLLAQAQANRFSGRPGRRFDSLDALKKAANIQPGADLRNEAIAAMALPDMKPVHKLLAESDKDSLDHRAERYVHFGRDGEVTVCGTADRRQVRVLAAAPPPIFFCGWSGDDRLLALGFGENPRQFRIENVTTGQMLFSLTNQWIWNMGFSPDNRVVALVHRTTQSRTELKLIDLGTGKLLWSVPLGALPSRVRFSASGERIAIASD